MIVSTSENGGYYTCKAETLASENKCIFELTGSQPADWIQEPVTHDLDRTVGEIFYRGVQSYTGDMLSVSPKPWVNGDVLVGTTDPVTGDEWSGYALIFELIAPLRDMMMYNPDALTEDVWAKYTKALTDCKSKTEDYISRSGGGAPYSTKQVYEYLKNPNNQDIHHFILQYLEEGTVELICLSTNLEMEHCDVIRDTAGAVKDVDRCNCWFDAYEALYGVCPVFDMEFTTCSSTVGTTKCSTGTDETTDTGTEETTDTGTDNGGSVVPSGKPAGKPAAKP